MKRIWLVLSLGVAVLLGLSLKAQQTDTKEVIEQFLAQGQRPLRDYVAVRKLQAEASYLMQNRSGSIEVETRQQGRTFTYKVLEEKGSPYILNQVLRKLIEEEKGKVERGELEVSGFSVRNYEFNPVEKTNGEIWKILATPRRDDDLLGDMVLLVDSSGNLLNSVGKLLKSPHPLIYGVSVAIDYRQISGLRMPVCLKATAKIFPLGKSKLEMKYIYSSVNGVEVEGTK
jgi:hypothetical protein